MTRDVYLGFRVVRPLVASSPETSVATAATQPPLAKAPFDAKQARAHQEAWAKQHGITVTLLSDLNKETARAYDVLLASLAGIGATSARAAFVIGADGLVKYAEQTPTPKDLPNFEKVKAALAA